MILGARVEITCSNQKWFYSHLPGTIRHKVRGLSSVINYSWLWNPYGRHQHLITHHGPTFSSVWIGELSGGNFFPVPTSKRASWQGFSFPPRLMAEKARPHVITTYRRAPFPCRASVFLVWSRTQRVLIGFASNVWRRWREGGGLFVFNLHFRAV